MDPDDPFPRPFRMLLRPGKGSRGKNEQGRELNEGDQQSVSLASDTVVPNVSHTRNEQTDWTPTNQQQSTSRSKHTDGRSEHQIDPNLQFSRENSPNTTQSWTEVFPHNGPLSIPATFNTPENTRHEPTDEQNLLNRSLNDPKSVLDQFNNDSHQYNSNNSHRMLQSTRQNQSHSKPPSKPARSHRIEKRTREKPRIFSCTFCYDTFKSKHDWVRHERSLHLDLETWTCAPDQGTSISPSSGQPHCVYCDYPDPTSEHIEGHNHNACAGTDRTFSRKDHLMQHLRLVHHVKQVPAIENWKKDAPSFICRCGFCDRQLNGWKERMDHLAAHFRKGYTMHDWQGDHGFPPSIATQVRNVIPPYLLGEGPRIPGNDDAADEQMDIDQSSLAGPSWNSNLGTTEQLHDHSNHNNIPQDFKAFSDLLALHLSGFARDHVQQGIFPTDEMFQRESQRLTDNWNQTMTENPDSPAIFQQQNEDTQGGDLAPTGSVVNKLPHFLL